ncbi:ABC transporter substrate-binding protein [Cellulomonas sp. Sa3CUA2]|uniref:ABC transporter substrate-binding protein n=1 Tax=Cellulomonas avistercoris TaxID=2762242 RepID=A0ABR8QGT6_9CELL|nr:ABC transporter substrate-binding protein [Cellulomonas avistercoris]MBD7919620.1 ABC transporter substrate-binding protein [Cellulomonas avistercoris]
MRSQIRPGRVIALTALIGLALGACASTAPDSTPATTDGTAQADDAPAAGEPVTVRLAALRAMPCAPTTQWLDHLPAGSKVEVTFFTAPADQVAALMSGSVDAACTGITIGLVANEQEQDIRIVAQTATKGTQLLAATDSGITSVADLRGKKVASVPNSIHEVILRELLEAEGMDPATDLELINIALADQPGALCSGQVDAIAGNEPNSSFAILQGCGTQFADPYDTAIGAINIGIFTSQALIDSDPALVQAIVDAQAASVEALNDDPSLALDVATEWGFDKAAVEQSLENLDFEWMVDDAFIASYATFANRIKAIGMTKTEIDVEPIVNTTFARAVTTDGDR